MAEGFAKALGGDAIDAHSAGSKPSGIVNPKGIASMKEIGIDISTHTSKGLDVISGEWDAVVTMGCGDACPNVPAKRRLDWALEDPKHMPPEEFAKVRDDIKARVEALLAELRA